MGLGFSLARPLPLLPHPLRPLPSPLLSFTSFLLFSHPSSSSLASFFLSFSSSLFLHYLNLSSSLLFSSLLLFFHSLSRVNPSLIVNATDVLHITRKSRTGYARFEVSFWCGRNLFLLVVFLPLLSFLFSLFSLFLSLSPSHAHPIPPDISLLCLSFSFSSPLSVSFFASSHLFKNPQKPPYMKSKLPLPPRNFPLIIFPAYLSPHGVLARNHDFLGSGPNPGRRRKPEERRKMKDKRKKDERRKTKDKKNEKENKRKTR